MNVLAERVGLGQGEIINWIRWVTVVSFILLLLFVLSSFFLCLLFWDHHQVKFLNDLGQKIQKKEKGVPHLSWFWTLASRKCSEWFSFRHSLFHDLTGYNLGYSQACPMLDCVIILTMDCVILRSWLSIWGHPCEFCFSTQSFPEKKRKTFCIISGCPILRGYIFGHVKRRWV